MDVIRQSITDRNTFIPLQKI